MKAIYFDCFAGISGDMTLGALVDAGLDIEKLKTELAKLKLEGYTITTEKVTKNGITGTKVNVQIEEQKAHRHLKHINEIIDNSDLGDDIKQAGKKIFLRLAEAEAKIHNTTIEKIHFHEVGAIDAIIDIVGSVIGIKLLGIEKIYASRIHVGRGFVDCRHGKIPVPAPATVELLKDVPVFSTGIEKELTTPTGAAIISTLADSFGNLPAMNIGQIGYGAGTSDLEIPNLLRVMIGEVAKSDYETDAVTVIETNIDDMNPEFYEYVSEKLFKQGALDVYTSPVYMKKSRPGVLLSVIADNDRIDDIISILFSETTTIGVRMHQVERMKLQREITTVNTIYGDIRVKISKYKGQIKNIAPEYDDCKKIADENNIPLKDIYDAAKKAAPVE
ncbi:MAG: TIGR00299 family protein [candidate division Zixibacteria bacterium HGW-Zixibacteria-1]|nr:MAG: TIGR00299 family protein [candidate division Zixibacteria bacterium HGW-Zixibacteria-1]